jgi:hypothetical protein
MSAMAEQIAATLAAMGLQVPEAVVSCAHPFADSAGNPQTQTFDAIESEMTAKQQISLFGTLDNKASTLTIDLLRFPMMVYPKSGDRITKRKGDAAATKHVVMEPVTLTLDTVLTLTIGPDNG